MARLPQPGGDSGNWGDILNDYLSQVHNADGTLKNDVVGLSQLQPGSVAESNLTSAVQTKLNQPANIPDGSIAKTKLVTSVQGSLDKADSALQTAPVTSVNTLTGAVTLTKTDVGLGSVDNTADTEKPVSTAQQSALDLKADTSALAAKLNTADLDAQAANKITTDGTATQVALSAAFVPRWKASTAYTAGDAVLAPDGSLVKAKVTFTSGATYSAANWTTVGATTGTQAKTELDAVYIPLTQKGAANGVLGLDGSGLIPVADLPTSSAPVMRATSGAPTVLATDIIGDFAVDVTAGNLYGPLTGTPVLGQPWINGGTSGAAITTLGPGAFQPITASGTLTAPTAGVYEVGVVAGGGGGAGGGTAATTGTAQTGAGGGASGITSIGVFTLTASQVLTYVIGAGGGGGAGGATGGNVGIVGTNGTASSVTGTGVALAAGGGGGGSPSAASSTTAVTGGIPGIPQATGSSNSLAPGFGGATNKISGGSLGSAATGGGGGANALATGSFYGGSGGAAGALGTTNAAGGTSGGANPSTQGGDGGTAAANSGGGGGGGGGANGANRGGNGGTGGSGFGWMKRVG